MHKRIIRCTGIVCALLFCTIAASTDLYAQDQTERAWLRIETGTHTAQVRDAAADPAGQVLVTASDDKTARIWSLPDLRPLGVLRPPIGPGNEGRLYAVAISPDGRLAAVAGFTGPDAGHDNIYIFDLATRTIVRRIANQPNVIQSLAFAPDGRLAAGFGSASGVRVRVTRDGTKLFDDAREGADVFGLAFAPDGRLAASSWDGTVRLYDTNGTVLRTQSTEVGTHPVRLSFSPDGSRLAIGFNDVPAAEVRDGKTLTLLNRPDVAGLDGHWLDRAAWSADGRTVFAGGDVWDGNTFPAFAWDAFGAGARRVAAAGFDDAVTALSPLRDGKLAVATVRGNLVVTARDGTVVYEQRSSGQYLSTRLPPNTADPSWRLRLSRDGRQVEWVTIRSLDRLLRFDVSTADLSVGQPEAPGLTNWTERASGIEVTDWNGQTEPKVNRIPLKLDIDDSARSVSVANHRLLLGTLFSLRMYDAKGKAVWPGPVPVPGVAWRVNQSSDGRLAVAALQDGTIRWYRADNGLELLTLMVTEDAQRWVAFTPSGYYAAGPGSEDLIGWQVNRGPDLAADFFPASRFRDTFNRPDVVRRILDTLDETIALRQADAALGSTAGRPAPNPARDVLQDRPPVATIISPRDGTQLATGQADLLVEIRSPTGRPITRVEARIDGRPAQGAVVGAADPVPAPAPERAERRHITVPVAEGQDASIQVIAWSQERPSEAATIRLLGTPPVTPAPPTTDLSKHRLNAVLVGISAYQNPELRLKFAAKDANDLAEALRRQKGGLYREVNVHVVPQATATHDGILSEILWLRRQTTQPDVAVLFLAGHGVVEDVEYYFLTVDADPDSPSIRGLSGTDIRTQLRQIPGHTVALLDTCYAGALIGGMQTRDLPLDISKLVAEMSAAETGVAVYSATTNRQRAAELDTLNNGVFTAALLDVLNGRYGQVGASPIRVNYLASLLAERVRVLSGGRQASTYNALDPIRDMPLFVPR